MIIFDRISTLRSANRRAASLPDGWLFGLWCAGELTGDSMHVRGILERTKQAA